MGKITTLLAMAAAAVGGIYLTSDEGAKARKALHEKKNALKPVIEDLKKQTLEILEGTKEIDSDEIRVNIKLLIKEARKVLLEFDVDKTIESSKKAIQVAQRKIREANAEANKALVAKKTTKKQTTKKVDNKKVSSKKQTKTSTIKKPTSKNNDKKVTKSKNKNNKKKEEK